MLVDKAMRRHYMKLNAERVQLLETLRICERTNNVLSLYASLPFVASLFSIKECVKL